MTDMTCSTCKNQYPDLQPIPFEHPEFAHGDKVCHRCLAIHLKRIAVTEEHLGVLQSGVIPHWHLPGNDPNERPGWIYVLLIREGYYKIGMTIRAVDRRIAEQGYTPEQIVCTIKTSRPQALESFLHDCFRYYGHPGSEFFTLSDAHIDMIQGLIAVP